MIKQEWEIDQGSHIGEIRGQILETPEQDNEEGNIENNAFEQLHSANPILPPGKHNDKIDTRKIKYKFEHQKEKLNKTTFLELRNKAWLNKTLLGGKLQGVGNSDEDNERKRSEDAESMFMNNDSEFRSILEGKHLAYLRLNNIGYNKIGASQTTYFASFFLNARKDSILSHRTPIFQYLPRICKDIVPIKPSIGDFVSFDSKFQSGNLFAAFLCPEESIPTYELFMQNDTNTKGCTQWFYFSVCSQKRIKLRLRLMNFYKPTSLYMKGMKVLVSSSEVDANLKCDWKRTGTAIQYNKVILDGQKQSYSLEFMYQLENPLQKYYFSYGFPYPYSHLEDFLNRISIDMPLYQKVAQKTIICRSYLGNNVYFITITDNIKHKSLVSQTKPSIYIIGRQHPGETPGSYIMEGLLRTLLSNRIQMERLRQQFIIKVVPMVNVDGVIGGNYRSNFSGSDVNRQWFFPSKKLHPELYSLKQEILSNKKQAHFFLDIHAHSRKMNSFFYGSKPMNHEARLYPFICSKLSKYISFQESSFVDDPSKKTTARVVLQTEAALKKSLTFEASFYGWEDHKKKSKMHFKIEDFRSIGETLAIGFFYSEIGIPKNNQSPNKQENSNIKLSTSSRLGNEKPKKKTQMEIKIENNIQKMSQKWKKQVASFNNDELASQGSSLDPEHFQLQFEEEENLQTLSQHIQIVKGNSTQNIHHSNEENQNETKRQINTDVILQKKGKLKSFRKNQYSRQKQKNVHETISYSNLIENEEQQTKMSFFPFQSNLRNTQMMKNLESQLQIQRSHKRYGSNREKQRKFESERQKLFKNQIIRGERFKSIQVEKSEPPPNYKNNIIEMKKALKYFIENKTYNYKSADYDDYKNFMRYSNGRSLILSQKDSVARIKKKYTKV